MSAVDATPRRLLAALAALAALSCRPSDATPVPVATGPVDFQIDGIAFRLSSAANTLESGVLTLHLTSHVDTCAALAGTPTLTTVYLTLAVAPAADGTTAATVVTGKLVPGPGEAVGGIVQQTSGATDRSFAASDGTVTWTVAANGTTVTVDTIDVGFAGASGRVTTSGVVLPRCP